MVKQKSMSYFPGGRESGRGLRGGRGRWRAAQVRERRHGPGPGRGVAVVDVRAAITPGLFPLADPQA